MKIAVTGTSGLIGSALVAALRRDGHEVLRLVRRPLLAPDEVPWDPPTRTVDLDALAGTEAVVHLAGAGLGDRRWTPAYKRQVRDSRVLGTAAIAEALTKLDPPPSALVSASAVGVYGDRGDEKLDEASALGTGFLAELCRDWEAATAPAQAHGVRVVHLRTGLVMARRGGTWQKLLPLFRLGLGGPLGSGRQWWSFITLTDEVNAIRHLLMADQISGPVNLTAPYPATNRALARALARALHRPALAPPVPAIVLRAAIGEFGPEAAASQRALPLRLLDSGFTFAHPTAEAAVATLVG